MGSLAAVVCLLLLTTCCLGGVAGSRGDSWRSHAALGRRRVLQQQTPPAAPVDTQQSASTTQQPPSTSGPNSTGAHSTSTNSTNSTSSNGANAAADQVTIDVCPMWALPQPKPAARGFNLSGDQAQPVQLAPEALTQMAREAIPIYNSTADAEDVPGLFEMLTEQESINAYTFLLNQTELNLTATDAAANNDNYIIGMELQPPPKDEAVAWLDYQDRLAAAAAAATPGAANGVAASRVPVVPRPPRMALAIILQGRANPKRAIQVVVGPLPNPTGYKQVPMAPGVDEAAWWQRPYSTPEADRVNELIGNASIVLTPLMVEAFGGYRLDNCTDKCLTYSLGSLFGRNPGDRQIWAFFYRFLEGHYLHTVGLEILADMSDDDPAKWHASKVWFNGQVFESPQALMAAYKASDANGPPDAEGRLPLKACRSKVPNDTEAQYSTFQHRPQMRGLPGQPVGQPLGPVQFDPVGRRFTLTRNHIEWMGWALDVSNRPTAGLGFWDIRFQGERIAYEISLQEAFAGYGGPSPMQSHTVYFDSHWGMGSGYRELVAGVDCPSNAAFLDIIITFQSPGPSRVPNALCVFELATGLPVMRHWADAGGSLMYYGAVPGSVLVVRGIAAVYNYDYIMDLRLHLDGSIETQVHTTGYVQAVHYEEYSGKRYGYPLFHDVSGTIHDHVLNWKVDLDIAGRNNSFRADRIGVEQGPNRWTGEPWASKINTPTLLTTEAAAAIHPNDTNRAGDTIGPSYLSVINQGSLNRWGSARGYRVIVDRTVPQLLPDNFTLMNSLAWSRYKVAVTRYKDGEQSSSSQFNQAVPAHPVVDFDKYVSDNENITDTDLVLWITSGLLHLPGSEDAPVTPTTGNQMGFMLRPFNYFDANAAANVADMVYIPGPAIVGEDALGRKPLDATLADTPATNTLRPATISDANNTAVTTSNELGIGEAAANIAFANITAGGFGLVDALTADEEAERIQHLQPWVGLDVASMCLPNVADNIPIFINGAY